MKFRTHIYHFRYSPGGEVYEVLALEFWDVDFWRTIATKELT